MKIVGCFLLVAIAALGCGSEQSPQSSDNPAEDAKTSRSTVAEQLDGQSGAATDSSAAATKLTTIKVVLSGAHCEECTRRLRAALKDLPGIKFNADDVQPGPWPEFWSSRFMIEIADIKKTGIGAIAKVVAEADTTHKSTAAPGLFLLLPWKVTLVEDDAEKLHPALANLPGVDRKASMDGDLYAWIKLDGSGTAKLSPIVKSLSDAGLIDPTRGATESDGWFTDYAAAKAKARESGKPILLVFR